MSKGLNFSSLSFSYMHVCICLWRQGTRMCVSHLQMWISLSQVRLELTRPPQGHKANNFYLKNQGDKYFLDDWRKQNTITHAILYAKLHALYLTHRLIEGIQFWVTHYWLNKIMDFGFAALWLLQTQEHLIPGTYSCCVPTRSDGLFLTGTMLP